MAIGPIHHRGDGEAAGEGLGCGCDAGGVHWQYLSWCGFS